MPSRLGSQNKNKRLLLNRLHIYGDDFHSMHRMAENAEILHKIAAETKCVSNLKASIDT